MSLTPNLIFRGHIEKGFIYRYLPNPGLINQRMFATCQASCPAINPRKQGFSPVKETRASPVRHIRPSFFKRAVLEYADG
jgi:hypothetical protein